MILVKSKLVETIQEFSLGWHFNLNLQTRIKSFMLKFMFGSAINDHPVLLLCHTYDHTQHYCYVTRVTTHGATVMLDMWPPTVLLLFHVWDHPQCYCYVTHDHPQCYCYVTHMTTHSANVTRVTFCLSHMLEIIFILTVERKCKCSLSPT